MTTCNGCGRCCDPVVLPYTQQQATMAPTGVMDERTRRWVVEDLTPIGRRVGKQLVSDYMVDGVSHCEDASTGLPVVLYSYFYTCRWYNTETRQCEAYDRRPPICSGFPWYGGRPDPTKAIPPECAFRADVGQPVRLLDRPPAVAHPHRSGSS